MTKEQVNKIKKSLPKGWLDVCHAEYVKQSTRRCSKSAMRTAVDNAVQKSAMYIFWLEWATEYLKELYEKETKLINYAKNCKTIA